MVYIVLSRMQITGVYMKQQQATAKLLLKGYTLAEGVKALGICLRTYRNWIDKKPDELSKKIDELKEYGDD